jgi:hypothetical protein
MKQILLKRLTLDNFQGGSFTLDAGNGDNLDIYADNGLGKTRLNSAFSWLLTGKDSLGRADFQIKNTDIDGNQEHGIEHSVEAVIGNGDIDITLRKVYHEIWSKKRGSAKSEMTGNTTDHFIDGVPVKESEYKNRVAEITGDEERFRLLTTPTAFPALHWQKQRAILLEVCGDVSDAQVIESDPALAPLTELLKRFTVSKTPLDDLRKVTTGRKSEINKQIDTIPVRIDECRKGMPDITGLDRETILKDVTRLEASLNEAKGRLNGIDNGSKITELSKKLAGINADIQKIESEYGADANRTISKLDQQINEIANAKDAAGRKQTGISMEISLKRKEIERVEGKLEILRAKWVGIDAEVFQGNSIEEICFACNRPLEPERVEEAREKAREMFNLSKAERLGDVTAEGKKYATQKDNLTLQIANLYQELGGLEDTVLVDASVLISERDELKKLAEDYSGIKEHRELTAQKVAIEAQIRDARESVSFDKDLVTKEITEIEEQLRTAKALADVFPRREAGEKRVVELKAEEKKMAKEFEELERQIFLIESFIKAKVSMLNEKINCQFGIVRFKLFNVLVNGGIEDCCVCTVNGIPYDSGLNSAGRTQAGLDIIRTLQRHYGIAPVVWIDNRESCVKIPDMPCQIINLYVSPEDKKLRVETAEGKRRAA